MNFPEYFLLCGWLYSSFNVLTSKKVPYDVPHAGKQKCTFEDVQDVASTLRH